MTRLDRFSRSEPYPPPAVAQAMEFWLDLWDALKEPWNIESEFTRDVYAGLLTLLVCAIVANVILAMFGHPLVP